METFGQRLKRLRISKKMTQDELAQNFGMKKHAVYSWEKERAEPCIKDIVKLADILGVEATYLLKGESQEKKPTLSIELEKRGISEDEILKLPEERKRLLYKVIDEFVNHVT